MQARKAAQEGDKATAEALYSQTVDVTPEMAHELVVHLRSMARPIFCHCHQVNTVRTADCTSCVSKQTAH